MKGRSERAIFEERLAGKNEAALTELYHWYYCGVCRKCVESVPVEVPPDNSTYD